MKSAVTARYTEADLLDIHRGEAVDSLADAVDWIEGYPYEGGDKGEVDRLFQS